MQQRMAEKEQVMSAQDYEVRGIKTEAKYGKAKRKPKPMVKASVNGACRHKDDRVVQGSDAERRDPGN